MNGIKLESSKGNSLIDLRRKKINPEMKSKSTIPCLLYINVTSSGQKRSGILRLLCPILWDIIWDLVSGAPMKCALSLEAVSSELYSPRRLFGGQGRACASSSASPSFSSQRVPGIIYQLHSARSA